MAMDNDWGVGRYVVAASKVIQDEFDVREESVGNAIAGDSDVVVGCGSSTGRWRCGCGYGGHYCFQRINELLHAKEHGVVLVVSDDRV